MDLTTAGAEALGRPRQDRVAPAREETRTLEDIALIQRGSCTFDTKVANAQAEGDLAIEMRQRRRP